MNRSDAIISIFKWSAICLTIGIMVGSAIAFFLWALDRVTETHLQHSWLLFLLPLGGLISGLMYFFLGKNLGAGNALIIEQIREPSNGIPWKIAPLVLTGTLITHLLGGSAGREGTAVQMGGSLAGALGNLFRLTPEETRILWMCGLAAGFGAVFGTPITGAVFAIEIIGSRRLCYLALLPCLVTSWAGHLVSSAWGIQHANYQIDFSELALFSGMLIAKIVFASFCFAGASILYTSLTHCIRTLCNRAIAIPWLRPAVGGCALVVLVLALGERDYCGLSVHSESTPAGSVTIETCFEVEGANRFSWFWKILFTSITVGSGFQGGEVTPLFFVGAALGNSLALLLGVPADILAGLGLVAVFAGATKSPIASTILAAELFHPLGSPAGFGFLACAAFACFAALMCRKKGSHEPKSQVPQV
jgi:H+/Cl- antiporter ClcA